MALGATRSELGMLLPLAVLISGGVAWRSWNEARRMQKSPEVTIPSPEPGWQPVMQFNAGERPGTAAIPSMPPSPTPMPEADPASPAAIDLNLAGVDDLQRLPGIGPARAAAIVATRASIGGFKSLNDLEKVPGIGLKSIERLRPYAFVQLAQPQPQTPSWPKPSMTAGTAAPTGMSSQSSAPIAHEPGIININTATAEELDSIPGIGPALAQRIIIHRARRPFARPEDLVEVQGIGPKTFEKMRAHVKVSD